MDSARRPSPRAPASTTHRQELRRFLCAGILRPVLCHTTRDDRRRAGGGKDRVETRHGCRTRILRGGGMKTQFRKIVIGIDFSDASLAGARWVATHLAADAELLVVHVVPIPQPPAYLHGHIGPTILQRSVPVPHLYTALQEFADLLGRRRVRVGIRTGVPWSTLARVATEVKADLICVGRGHNRRGS